MTLRRIRGLPAGISSRGGSSTVGGGRQDQHGSGTLLMVVVAVIMLALVSSLALVGRYLVARDRARAAADLAALAGAQAYGSGGDGCSAAKRSALRNGERVENCFIVGDRSDFVLTVRIVAAVPVRSAVLPHRVAVEAHAGPVR